jgi:hypothetical protein
MKPCLVALSLALALPFGMHAPSASAQSEPGFYIEQLWFNPNPATLDIPFTGLFPHLRGPFPIPVGLEELGAVDVGGVSGRPELLLRFGPSILWADLEADQVGPLVPAPPVPLTALLGIQVVGTARLDLVGVAGSDAWVLDFDALPPAWSGPTPLGMSPVSLAAVDLVGGTERDLIVAAGAQVVAIDVATPGWPQTPLLAPPAIPEVIAAGDIAIGGPPLVSGPTVRMLVLYSGGSRYFYETSPPAWVGPWLDRFETRSATSFHLGYPGPYEHGGFSVPSEVPPDSLRLERVTDAVGLEFPLDPGGDGHCPGAIFSDLTGDGLADIYLVRGDFGAGPDNLLYTGDGTSFAAVASAGGASDPRNGAGALAIDYDNDGDRDLYVVNFDDRNSLLRNDGGVFVDVTDATDPTPADPAGDRDEGVGVGISFASCEPGETPPCALDDSLSAGWGDVNRDGWLDLYVGNHLCCNFPDGERDVLYLNNGDGTFTDITLSSGISAEPQPGGHPSNQAMVIADLNDDGWPDIYAANKDNGPPRDQLFLNAGDPDTNGWDGTFSDWYATQPLPLGAVTNAAMGTALGDYDNDGDLDLFLTDVGDMDLLRNRLAEDGVFSLEIVLPNPVPSPWLSWGTSWVDFDNDGDVDLHVSSNDGQMDHLHRNDGAGVFTDVTLAAGVAQAWDSRASVPADYDRDGRVDLLVVQRGDQPVSVFRNQSAPNGWLQVRLEGDPGLPGFYRSTRDAVGARIDVVTAAGTQRRDVIAGGHTCGSTGDYTQSFGLGGAAQVDELRVHWPSGRTTQLTSVAIDQLMVLREGDVDSDGDGLRDVLDNCPFVANPGQADVSGDGIGDDCQCADVSDDGGVNILDVVLGVRSVASLPPGLPASEKCSVIGSPYDCTQEDVAAMRDALAGLAGLAQICEAAVGTI